MERTLLCGHVEFDTHWGAWCHYAAAAHYFSLLSSLTLAAASYFDYQTQWARSIITQLIYVPCVCDAMHSLINFPRRPRQCPCHGRIYSKLHTERVNFIVFTHKTRPHGETKSSACRGCCFNIVHVSLRLRMSTEVASLCSHI